MRPMQSGTILLYLPGQVFLDPADGFYRGTDVILFYPVEHLSHYDLAHLIVFRAEFPAVVCQYDALLPLVVLVSHEPDEVLLFEL